MRNPVQVFISLSLGLGALLSWAQAADPPVAAPAVAIKTALPFKQDSGAENYPLAAVTGLLLAGLILGAVYLVLRKRAGLPMSVWRWRALGQLSATPLVQRRATLRLDVRNTVHILEWHGKQLLVACNDSKVIVLDAYVPAGTAPAVAAHEPMPGETP